MEKPYTLGSTDATGSRYCVHRTSDKSIAGYIWRNAAGQWGIEDALPALSDGRPVSFADLDEAALFAYMKGRCYQATIPTPSESIQIRVSPNFGQRASCPLGQWFASLYHGDGETAGSDRCSASLAEAKTRGLRNALLNNNLTTEDANQLEWREAA